MYGHGSTIAERVRSDVFWGESKSGRAHLLGFIPDDGDDVQGADRAETLICRVVSDCGGRVASMFLQVEEDVDACSNWLGSWRIRSEVRDGLTLDGVLLVVQGEDDLGDVLKLLNRGVWGEEGVANEEYKFQEWTELDCPAMAGALGVLSGT